MVVDGSSLLCGCNFDDTCHKQVQVDGLLGDTHITAYVPCDMISGVR